MKAIPTCFALALPLIAMACTESEEDVAPVSTENSSAFVIRSRSPSVSDTSDRNYFEAVNISTKQGTPIFSIRETGGRMYLPIMSSIPECNHKVVEGHIQLEGFDKQSVFVTTKILRDTTVATVGI